MYGHKCIDFLSKANVSKSNINAMISKIKSAQHFGLNGITETIRNMPEYKKGGTNPYVKNVKLPFPLCWFGWDHSPIQKNGVLIEDLGDRFKTTVFEGSSTVFMPVLGMSNLINKTTGKFEGEIIVEIPELMEFAQKELGEDFNRVGYESSCIGLGIVFFALQILNCKNIGTYKIKAPKRLNKKRAKKNKQPLFSYHVLEIKNKPGLKLETHCGTKKWQQRVHLCRGHFKTYTKENPLFGSIAGTYWWQPQARGNVKKGVILKDYKVGVA